MTQNDEVNFIASLLAKDYGVPQTVARIQTEELRGPRGKALRDAMRADLIIDPDADTADEIMELARVSGADEVYRMADGDLVVIGAVISELVAARRQHPRRNRSALRTELAVPVRRAHP